MRRTDQEIRTAMQTMQRVVTDLNQAVRDGSKSLIPARAAAEITIETLSWTLGLPEGEPFSTMLQDQQDEHLLHDLNS